MMYLRTTAGLFVIGIIGISAWTLINSVNQLKSVSGMRYLEIPFSSNQLMRWNKAIDVLIRDHFYTLLQLWISIFLLKQILCLPGAGFLNMMGGRLLGSFFGLLFTCVLTTFGATCCYFLSYFLFQKVVEKCCYDRLILMKEKIKENQNDLFWYIVSLRIFPMFPQWFINISSPYVVVHLKYFIPSIFFGLLPYNYVCVQTGVIFKDVQENSGSLPINMIIKFTLLALGIISMVILKNYLNKKKLK